MFGFCLAKPYFRSAELCKRWQALISCGRYTDALAAVSDLIPGTDRQYLQVEALWRSGQLACALAGLAAVRTEEPGSGKCRTLFALLSRVMKSDAAASAALADGAQCMACLMRLLRRLRKLSSNTDDAVLLPGRHAECVQLCAQALALPAVRAASGLRARLLERRARAQMAQGAHKAALADLAAALALEPTAANGLLLRSQVMHAP